MNFEHLNALWEKCEHNYYFCYRKIPVKRRRKARRIAKLMTNAHGVKFNAYKCLICGKYHVGRVNKHGG